MTTPTLSDKIRRILGLINNNHTPTKQRQKHPLNPMHRQVIQHKTSPTPNTEPKPPTHNTQKPPIQRPSKTIEALTPPNQVQKSTTPLNCPSGT
ncbi:MAG: hypothetical protein LBI79_02905 [Nitrososphaerota archaeon]|nr:hypothetical protein [Nitrososphaerota archaeon]